VNAQWQRALGAHRGTHEISDVTARLRAHGVTADTVLAVLSDPNRFLNAFEHDGPGWTHRYGGPVGAALIASELAHYLRSRQRAAERLRLDLIAEMASSVAQRPDRRRARPGLHLVDPGTNPDEIPLSGST
jgi:hypothetical protein